MAKQMEMPIDEEEVVKTGEQRERAWGDDDFVGIEFLTWPKVGEEETIKVCKVIETKDTKIVSRKTGKTIDLSLSGVDYTVYIEDNSKTISEKLRRLNISAWEVVGKLKKILRERKEAQKPLWGWTMTIQHLKEGKQTGEKQENYNLIEKE